MTNSGRQLPDTAPRNIAILNYPGAQSTCIHGLSDLFMYADYFARMHRAGHPPSTPHPALQTNEALLRVSHWRELQGGAGFECYGGDCQGSLEKIALVIVPAYQLGPPARGHSPAIVKWIQRLHADGAAIASVCGGVFLLAESGLLAGRRVTTHWKFAAELKQRFPDLMIDADRLVVDDQDIITAGGVLAWVDLGLTMVERLLGRSVMVSTANFMIVDPPGREQSFYDEFAPSFLHGDRAVLAIQHWLQANPVASVSVSSLAERSGLGARTFLRRFVRATGMRPTEYQQRLRIARSREMMEFTRDNVDTVAQAVGYEDTSGFRRVFKRVVGLSPAEYRRRFRQ